MDDSLQQQVTPARVEIAETPLRRPTLHELGDDLTQISMFRRWCSVISPFMWCSGYFVFAAQEQWAPAFLCVVVLSFVTYGSVSHDLVHRNLGLQRRINDLLLVMIELLALRSGTAYRLAHLHHHRRYPAADDVEGAAAKMKLMDVLLEGVRFQLKLFRWAWLNHPGCRKQLSLEGSLILSAYLASIAVLPWSAVPFAYAALMTAGAWTIPLITSYIPHDSSAKDEIHQTRAFRGVMLSLIAVDHLYHLEHHLYPAVPHQNWPKLARRLEPFLRASGVRPVRLWF
jgi:beta-carotene hydroxylase